MVVRLLVIAVLCAAGTAHAGKIAIANVAAEPDFGDEAGAVSLLVRSTLLGDDRQLVDAPNGITVPLALVMMEKVGAEHAVLMDLGRDGMKLRLTVAIIGLTEGPKVKVINAGDGDVVALARGAVEHVETTLKIMKRRVPDISFGRLRPYAAALRLKATDPQGAIAALGSANPTITLAVPACGTLLAGLPELAKDPIAGMIAARAIGDHAYLDKRGADTTELGAAARAMSALVKSDSTMARTELGTKPPKTAVVTLISAILAEIAGDRKLLEQLIVQGLGGDQARSLLAFAAHVGPFEKPTLAAMVASAETHLATAPGVATLVGLQAAEAGVEVSRALALVSARYLDDAEVKRLEPLVAKGSDATLLRLRAELALRRGDEKAVVAIGTFASEAPNDPRSARYQGWLLESKGKFVEAAAQFKKAGAPREAARVLVRGNDIPTAVKTLDGKSTAEEMTLIAQTALLAAELTQAEKALLFAEQQAPVNPIVQRTIAQLAAKRNDDPRLRLARILTGDPVGDIPEVVTPAPVVVGGGSQQKPVGSTPEKVVIDLSAADPRILEPMLEALTLAQYGKKKLVIAELGWSPGMFSFRETHPDIVRDALVKLVGAAPYDMHVSVEPTVLEGSQVPLDGLVKLTGELDAALVYRVEASGSHARITLLLYTKDSTQATQVSREVDMPGVVTFNSMKLVVILGVLLVVVLVGVLYFTRSMGKIEVQIARTAEADEALCLEITKNPKRPVITDMLAFHAQTKNAGAVAKSRVATLIASGFTMRVPTGNWYVHLYGTYQHANKLRIVPDTCTHHVDVKRGTTVEVAFDLIAKAAEIQVEVVYEPRKDNLVWINSDTNNTRKTSDEGKVDFFLPVGHYTIHIKTAKGDELSMPLHVASAKAINLSVNVSRELRLLKDLDIGDAAENAKDLELVLSHGPRTPLPFAAPADPTAKTQHVSPAAVPPSRTGTPVPGETLLGRYKITSELGRGAMGIVQRAWDEKLEREVAIKLMADDLRAIPEAMALFTSEAKALAQLNHTNIVAMYDQITDSDKVYMVMEYVDGQTLEQVIADRGGLAWMEAAAIIDQVCTGLAYAHARKVIHRDIKPANIFVAKDKTVKLGDFGLARVMREVVIRRTEVRGTPLYMAPEQIKGTDVDHRSDLYAIGCMLFELVTGRPPFIEGDILYAQMNLEPPLPSSIKPDIPKQLDDLILSLMKKDPDDRPGSAAEVRTTLRDISTV